MLPSVLRTGLGTGGADPAEAGAVETTVALLRVFSKEALGVAGRMTAARRGRVVKEHEMRHALKYCARTFLQQWDEATLAARIAAEREAMAAESDDEGEGEGESDGSTAPTADDASDGSTAPTDDDATDEDEALPADAPVSPRDEALVRHVATIVAGWPRWAPTDPVHAMLKRAIDATDAQCGDGA